VELHQGAIWRRVDVHTVFRNKDEIRFLFRTSFRGYLKVVNYSSDGETASLFPKEDSGQVGEVQANKDYVIPAARGSFVVGGKPGFDLTEWLVSSDPVAPGDWQLTGRLPQESTLLPKCSQELQGRRSCLDGRAGPAPVPPSDDKNTADPDAPLISRDLSFGSRDLSTLIAVPDTSRKLVVYEFRVAHH
jgi:hypothetical protein